MIRICAYLVVLDFDAVLLMDLMVECRCRVDRYIYPTRFFTRDGR